ncbi:MAG: hypothetical protein JXQ71_17410 [Verrucomicrobia bacterium]|nr:hypothetical protein [Verrucomicrobiota bacterium]
MSGKLHLVLRELKVHAPFTSMGTLTGLMVLGLTMAVPRAFAAGCFWTLHPIHVLLSAMVTTAMFRRHGSRSFWATLAVGYLGSVGIATVSDCVIPFFGEWLLALPRRGLHLGFIEKAWLVNPLALAGIAVGVLWPRTKVSHLGHVLLSTWASLFHVVMALGDDFPWSVLVVAPVLLFLSVWLPCCTSDIVFPLLFARRTEPACAAGAFPGNGIRVDSRPFESMNPVTPLTSPPAQPGSAPDIASRP